MRSAKVDYERTEIVRTILCPTSPAACTIGGLRRLGRGVLIRNGSHLLRGLQAVALPGFVLGNDRGFGVVLGGADACGAVALGREAFHGKREDDLNAPLSP